MNPLGKSAQQNRKYGYLGVILLLASALFFAFIATFPESSVKKESISAKTAYSPMTEQRVNQHLFVTSKKIELEQQQAALKNDYYAPAIGDSVWPKVDSHQKAYGVDHSSDANEDNAIHDLARDSKELNYESPNAVIEGQLHDQDKQQEYEEAYKKEYVRQFVENARQNGYNVKVSDDFVVLSVTPTRLPSQESTKIFNSSGAGAQ